MQDLFVGMHNLLARFLYKRVISYEMRMALYRMLEKMTGEPASVPVNDAILELRNSEERHGYRSKMWYVYDDVLEKMRSTDAGLSKALQRYIPAQDMMVLAAAEHEDITQGFKTLINSNKELRVMKVAFYLALGYPLFLVGLLLAVVGYFSVKIIPAMTLSLSPGAELSGVSEVLVMLTQSFYWWFPGVLTILVVIIGYVVWALPNMVNRWRKYLEGLPPFNMYRIMLGCGFLFSLNSLGRSGFQQIDALEHIYNLAKPYLKYRVGIIMDLMADGLDMGQALIYSKLDFPDKKMVQELAIQIKYSEADDTLELLSANLVADGLDTIKKQARLLNALVTFIVFSAIGFLYLGVYNLGQDVSNLYQVSFLNSTTLVC